MMVRWLWSFWSKWMKMIRINIQYIYIYIIGMCAFHLFMWARGKLAVTQRTYPQSCNCCLNHSWPLWTACIFCCTLDSLDGPESLILYCIWFDYIIWFIMMYLVFYFSILFHIVLHWFMCPSTSSFGWPNVFLSGSREAEESCKNDVKLIPKTKQDKDILNTSIYIYINNLHMYTG